MEKVNLFQYATSELSQDAFICWLLAHGKKKHQKEDSLLCACALDFIHQIPGLEHATQIDEIKRQYLKIDVLVIVDGIHIIIEDKTYMNVHGDQIAVYKDKLVKEGIPADRIRTVYYKIVEQPYTEQVDCTFSRTEILKLLRKYKNCTNNIFQDYLLHLEELESRSNIFNTAPITEWGFDGTRGFFANLQKTRANYCIESWGYVSNPSGGFMGMWFHVLDDRNDEQALRKMGIYEYIESIYLQFENDTAFSGDERGAEQSSPYILAVKVRANCDYKNTRYREASKIRRALYEEFKKRVPSFQKKDFHPGQYMTVGYVPYNEKNYDDQVSMLKSTLDSIVKEWSYK